MNIRNRIKELRVVTPDEVSPNPRNWRTHPQAQRDALRGVLAQVGIAAPVIAYETPNGLMLIDGHERMTVGVPFPAVILDVNDAEADFLLATFDPLTSMAQADTESLDALLREISTDSPAVSAMLDELATDAGLYAELPEMVNDEVPDPPVVPVTQLGDLWLLGNHRLLCGDATVNPGFGDSCTTLVFDPPWDSNITMPARTSTLAFCDGQRISDIVTLFGAPTWAFAWDCVSSWYTPNRPLKRMKLCLWYGDISQYNTDGSHYGDAGETRTVTNSRGSYEFEPDSRGKHLSDVFSAPITRLHTENEHSHSKPLDWIRMLIANCTTGNIYDPFAGSGTTLIAAEQIGRTCYAVEINPAYCDVIVKRWEQLTGNTAVLSTE